MVVWALEQIPPVAAPRLFSGNEATLRVCGRGEAAERVLQGVPRDAGLFFF